ncbi:MAG TPA: hypothetical protein VMS22_09570 [Candidatus Eisenbacteria bacterium]|nr:hypothetical protein [Candidatus Eisenbacteria bacterium]
MTRHRTNLPLLAALLLGVVTIASRAHAAPYDERSTAEKAGFTTAAAIMNVIPITATFVAPRCLPGYVFCKIAFAGISVVGAAEHVFLAGPVDDGQVESILYKGFAGDWYVTGRNVAGDVNAEPLPNAPTPAAAPAP